MCKTKTIASKKFFLHQIIIFFVGPLRGPLEVPDVTTFRGPSGDVPGTSRAGWEGTDQRSCVVSIIPGASAKFLHLSFPKMSYFTFKDETPAADKLERKRYHILRIYCTSEKMIYIDIGYKSASSQNRQVTKSY